MDIAGAKALKQRIAPNGTDDAPVVSVDVPADAPPVYHWVGIGKLPGERLQRDGGAASVDSASLFSRLGLSFR
ncbi:MAG TPA: hypothetical protein VFL58_04885 [Gaiellaceae bacterium]|nr:hypothetical protein [Gaiellaceae bacterium]